MVPIHSLLDAGFTKHMSTASDVRIIDGVGADVALELEF